jgi:hypothetical protein
MEKIEWGVSFDENDREQFRIKGNEEQVELTDEQRLRIYKECISFIHNHPFLHQQIFSEGDLRFFMNYPKMKEFEVVNMDGTYIISRMVQSPTLRERNTGDTITDSSKFTTGQSVGMPMT